MLKLWRYMAVLKRAKQTMCGGGGIAVRAHTHTHTHTLCAKRGWLVCATPLLLYPEKKRPGTFRTRGWVDLGAGMDLSEKSRPHRSSTPDRLARSESLYRLSYPGRRFNVGLGKNARMGSFCFNCSYSSFWPSSKSSELRIVRCCLTVRV